MSISDFTMSAPHSNRQGGFWHIICAICFVGYFFNKIHKNSSIG
jgi:hypothetical protein